MLYLVTVFVWLILLEFWGSFWLLVFVYCSLFFFFCLSNFTSDSSLKQKCDYASSSDSSLKQNYDYASSGDSSLKQKYDCASSGNGEECFFFLLL